MQAVLIFDGDCAFCTRTARLIGAQNAHRRFDVLPYQTEGLLAAVGLSEAQCQAAAWFVDERGLAARGAAAINAALNRLGGVFRVASWLYRVPGFTQIEDVVYAWVARNRFRMPGGTPACATPTMPRTADTKPLTD